MQSHESPSAERVAMLVFNACAPDHRVQKEAEALAEAGKSVRIFCLRKPGLPDFEVRNGVEYVRVAINWRRSLLRMIGWRR